MEYSVEYGSGKKIIRISEKANVSILQPVGSKTTDDLNADLARQLESPIGCKPLVESLRSLHPRHIAIAIPNETSPSLLKTILPILMTRIRQALPKLASQEVTLIIGGGPSASLNPSDMERIVPPDMINENRVIVHDQRKAPMVDFGYTSQGTFVRINAAYSKADFKIVIGQIEPHQFLGFTGGADGVVIGCGAAETVEHNLGLMFDQNARFGHLEKNPVREDVNESGEMVGINLAINFLCDDHKEVGQCIAGNPAEVLRKGSEICKLVHGVAIERKFDIGIASFGSYSKTISLYQVQRSLSLVSQAVKKDGHILFLTASRQGMEENICFDYVLYHAAPEEILWDFKHIAFKMGAPKAYLFGRMLTSQKFVVSSELDSVVMRRCHLRASNPEVIISEWVEDIEGHPEVGVIPNSNTTFFYED